jgi:hypothetical protein
MTSRETALEEGSVISQPETLIKLFGAPDRIVIKFMLSFQPWLKSDMYGCQSSCNFDVIGFPLLSFPIGHDDNLPRQEIKQIVYQ